VGLFSLLPGVFGGFVAGMVWLLLVWRGASNPWVLSTAAGVAGAVLLNVSLNRVFHLEVERYKKKLTLLSLQELEDHLKDPASWHLDLVLLEMKGRGADIKKYRAFLAGLLEGCTSRRVCASKAFRVVFPGDAPGIGCYLDQRSEAEWRETSERLVRQFETQDSKTGNRVA
jgi:hypothetical protein